MTAAPEATITLVRAFDFAARKHADQRRKGASAEPYINHLADVADLLARATDGADPTLVLGGLLHDTVEDTSTTLDELAQAFGADVAALVAEVSDDKTLPKAERKRLQVATAAAKSDPAKALKIADKISNLTAIADDPPRDWNDQRRLDYVHWARDVVAGCRGVNALLENWFDDVHARALAQIQSEGGQRDGS